MTHRRYPPLWILPCIVLPALLIGVGAARGVDFPGEKERQAAYDKEVKPLYAKYCFSCHGKEGPSAGVNLAGIGDSVGVMAKESLLWKNAARRTQDGTMPPSRSPQPTKAERETMHLFVTHLLEAAVPKNAPAAPGRGLIRRLSRTEYNNTLRDLLGIVSRPADSFPQDGGGGGGFDNDASTMFVPPVLMERYLDAATQALREAAPARLFVVRPGAKVTPRDAARQNIARFAFRAYRRPVTDVETGRLLKLYDFATTKKLPWGDAVKLAYKGALASPNFLFRVEQDKPGVARYAVNDYELASRLSYFLWASMPDDRLMILAAKKRLSQHDILQAEVTRMLADAKSYRFADSFATQWLRIRDLYSARLPDTKKYPGYTNEVRDALIQETVMFVHGVVKENAPLTDLVQAQYSYMNETVAKHYGIGGVVGQNFRRVAIEDDRRGGLLTQGSILTVTSYPQRTSPVLRGKWVLDELLGTPPPPPPANVGILSPSDAVEKNLTFRQRLEKHREKPQCASCHSKLDPLGFGLENYDAVGRWRDMVGGVPVDASGVMSDGTKFAGVKDLKNYLATGGREDFLRNISERMLSYAIGRGLETADAPTLRRITGAVAKDARSHTLIREIVQSVPFRYRQGSVPTKAKTALR